jgi:FecR protein
MTAIVRICCLFFLVVAYCQAAESKNTFATIDSLTGKAEVQRAGTQSWQKAAVGEKLYNNDMIRVLDKSSARLGWPDQSASYMHENSQLMLAFYEGDVSTIISRHITVMYGAVFFVIREILPKSLIKQYDTKIFTPTAVVSLRGTSFLVEVDDASKSSTVKVIRGTVLVRNILKNTSVFVSAGFKTTVEITKDPSGPNALLDKEIDSLKQWVPVPVIDQEMALQLAKAGRDHDVITGGLKDKIIILPFANSSKYTGPWNIQSGIARMLSEQLKHGHLTIEVIDSAGQDPLVAGVRNNARFVVAGEVLDFDIVQHAEIAATADEYREYYMANVRISVQIVNVADKRVIFESQFSSDKTGANVKENSWQNISKMGFSLGDQQFVKSILGIAVSQVIEQVSEKLNRIIKYE